MSMGAAGPEQAILDKLAGLLGVWEPGGRAAAGIQSGIVRGGNAEQADLTTVRFGKHRQSERRHVYFITFDGTDPRTRVAAASLTGFSLAGGSMTPAARSRVSSCDSRTALRSPTTTASWLYHAMRDLAVVVGLIVMAV
jgi:hypothetical protein